MSKIDEYRRAKAHRDSLKRLLVASRDTRCDKFGGKVTLTDTYEGYYGNSSCSRWGDADAKAVEAALQGLLRTAIEVAVDQAERAAETARRAAEQEAREVLGEVQPAQ